MSLQPIETTVETITRKKWELSGDDIEDMLRKHLGIPDNASVGFYWDSQNGYVKGVEVTQKTTTTATG